MEKGSARDDRFTVADSTENSTRNTGFGLIYHVCVVEGDFHGGTIEESPSA
jgi:hypothetical protein